MLLHLSKIVDRKEAKKSIERIVELIGEIKGNERHLRFGRKHCQVVFVLVSIGKSLEFDFDSAQSSVWYQVAEIKLSLDIQRNIKSIEN